MRWRGAVNEWGKGDAGKRDFSIVEFFEEGKFEIFVFCSSAVAMRLLRLGR